MPASVADKDAAGHSGASGPVILETKLAQPRVRAEHIARNELLELLRGSAAHRLTLLTAPPGFGKTTLLAAWAAAREDPPLPLGRLRARGELRELRAGELRFSDEEARAFLNDALGLGLSAEDVERLQARTEGWPAALYLAALSLRGRDDPSTVID